MNSLQSPLNLKAGVRLNQRYTKAMSSTHLHKKTRNIYMMLDMHLMNPLHDPHSHQET